MGRAGDTAKTTVSSSNHIRGGFKTCRTATGTDRTAAEINRGSEPKAEFYDDVVESKDALPMDMVAKTLNTGLGRNKLFAFLRDNGVLMRSNAPFQRYVDLGWFRCIETKFNKPNGDTCINIKTVVLQKGLDGIRKLLKERNKEITQSKKNYK